MRRYYLLGAIALFLAACGMRKDIVVEEKEDGSAVLAIKAAKNYLLLPMEDTAPEKPMEVEVDHEQFNTFVIRPALNRIDYWVPLDLSGIHQKAVTVFLKEFQGYELFLDNVKLADSFDYEYDEPHRPAFHFSPPYGWMNDPNGMVYYDGVYHLAYQFNPLGTRWQNMSWGHATSKDLVTWEHQPVALYPDTLGAIFSGSAVVDIHNTTGLQSGEEKTLLAYFTHAGPNGQVQSLAYSNDKGKTWVKYANNPILTHFENDPDFRDPKVFWHAETERWVMVIARSLKKEMEIYSSENGIDWQFESSFGQGQGAQGGIWECPDLFEMAVEGEAGESRWVLICNLNPGGPSGGSAAQYFIGDFDGRVFTNHAEPSDIKWMDWGKDHYATVTWSDVPESDGRRLAIGWMSNWEYANDVPTKNFRSAMTVARELKLVTKGEELVLASYPVEELEKLRVEEVVFDNLVVENEQVVDSFLGQNNGAYELTMMLDASDSDVAGLTLFNSKGESIDISINLSKGEMYMDRSNSGLTDFNDRFKAVTFAPVEKKEKYELRILVDKASVEIFEGKGTTVMTNVVFPTEPYNRLKFYTKGGSTLVQDLKIYRLN